MDRSLALAVVVAVGMMAWGATDVTGPLHAGTRWTGLGLLIILCSAQVCRTIRRNTDRQLRNDEHRRRREREERAAADEAARRHERDGRAFSRPMLTVTPGARDN